MVRVVCVAFVLTRHHCSLTQHDTHNTTAGVGVQCRSAEFDGEEATVAAVEQAVGQGVFTGAFNSLRKALADKTN